MQPTINLNALATLKEVELMMTMKNVDYLYQSNEKSLNISIDVGL
jgi:hypothetical protein